MHSIALERESLTGASDEESTASVVLSSADDNASFAQRLEIFETLQVNDGVKSASIFVQSSRLRLRDNTCDD
jgi:hypothetical protein